jgi:hypothetical protein
MWRRWRLIEDRELYDLASDPGQEHNVIAAHGDIAARMRAPCWWR